MKPLFLNANGDTPQNKELITFAGCLLMIPFLGGLDFLTGFEISFALFYIIPVFFATWKIGQTAGILISILCTITIQIANQFAGESFSSPLVPFWNSVIRLGIYLFAVYALSRLRAALDREKTLSRSDYLTQAANSRAFYETADAELSRTRRFHRPISLIYLDIDNFKTINDTFGHKVGDTLLQIVVRTIKENIRTEDLIARLGGDEFAILLPETSSSMAQNTLSRLQQVLLEEMQKNAWNVTFSFGVVSYIQVIPLTVEEMVSAADWNMYRVKENGKNGMHQISY
jgi:diguanylate cyclase (GGDEF)-like protein